MQKLNHYYQKNEGGILLFITLFSSFGLLLLIGEFTNIIHFII